jgi:hypothetical protein
VADDEFLEFSASAGQSDIAPGTYTVTLTEISEIRTNVAKRGPNAGEEFSIRDWTFFTDDDQEIRDSASVSRSTRSKQYEWITALLGGTPPALDQKLSLSSLIGREAIATVELVDGWPKIKVLSARPQERPKPASGAESPAAAARARAKAQQQPVAAAAASAPADDLPF